MSRIRKGFKVLHGQLLLRRRDQNKHHLIAEDNGTLSCHHVIKTCGKMPILTSASLATTIERKCLTPPKFNIAPRNDFSRGKVVNFQRVGGRETLFLLPSWGEPSWNPKTHLYSKLLLMVRKKHMFSSNVISQSTSWKINRSRSVDTMYTVYLSFWWMQYIIKQLPPSTCHIIPPISPEHQPGPSAKGKKSQDTYWTCQRWAKFKASKMVWGSALRSTDKLPGNQVNTFQIREF